MIRDIAALKPLAQIACRAFLRRCRAEGVDIFITETYRSQQRQNELWEQGRTKPGDIVTWTMKSRHTGGMAWDIACEGEVLYDLSVLRRAGEIAQELGITWGGSWITPDMPHFEITDRWEEPEMRYNTIEEVPHWGKETIQRLIDEGCFADTEKLDLSHDMVRMFVILDRKY